MEENGSKIVLEGELKTGGFRSGGDDITVETQGNMILASFYRDIGNVQVTFTNSTGGMVYETTINTSVQQRVLIPLSGLPSSKYTIHLVIISAPCMVIL